MDLLDDVDARLGRATPLHGQVKLVPSMRNAFSLTADPNTETVLAVELDGEVGDTPGAFLIASNMLPRRDGIVAKSPVRSAFEPAFFVIEYGVAGDGHRFGHAGELQDDRPTRAWPPLRPDGHPVPVGPECWRQTRR